MIDGCLELCNEAAEGFFLFGGDGGVGGAVSVAIVPSSNGRKEGFNLCKDFLEFTVLASG